MKNIFLSYKNLDYDIDFIFNIKDGKYIYNLRYRVPSFYEKYQKDKLTRKIYTEGKLKYFKFFNDKIYITH